MKGRNEQTGQLQNFVVVYQDDIMWWSSDEDDHKEMCEIVLAAFSREKLFLNPAKVHLACQYARYLGCIVGNSSLSMDPRKVDASITFSTVCGSLCS